MEPQRALAIVAPAIESDIECAAQDDAAAIRADARGDHDQAQRLRESAQRFRDSAARMRDAAERYGDTSCSRSPESVRTSLDRLRRHAVHTNLTLARVLDHFGLSAPTDEEIDAALGES